MKKVILVILSISMIAFLLNGCTEKEDDSALNSEENMSNEASPIDYSIEDHWLKLPENRGEYEVDVFYVYPTVYSKESDDDPNICAINNESMIEGAQKAYDKQATAFEPIGNIYAPYYEQADGTYVLSLPDDEHTKVMSGLPSQDVIAAFDYYMTNYNEGRPFILAGHSQGSEILLHLLSDYIADNDEILKQMIASYVIGYSVTEEYLEENPTLKFAENANDTGVIISYNTQAEEIGEPGDPVVKAGSLVINPITWTRDEALASADMSLGSLLLDENGDIIYDQKGDVITEYNFADAKIDLDKGVLICDSVDVDKYSPGNDVFGRGVYHVYDYPFYYFNIRENAVNRTNIFLENIAN